jgi:hypothetical protein
MVAGVALDVLGRWVVHLFHIATLADFSCCLWKAKRAQPAVATPTAIVTMTTQ